MMKTKLSIKTTGIILLIIILILHVIMLLYIAYQKKGMHIDEFYSYILSNSYDSSKISLDKQVWNNWLSGDDFKKFIAVEQGEQFAYNKVYYNNSLDAHPPLYYFLLHTVCSFFPQQYNPWFGISLNIVIILATEIVLFFLSKEITDNYLWGVVPVAIYGGMKAFLDTTLFIRMYSLMTLFTVLLVWKHYHLIKNPHKRGIFLWCAIITFLGTFTQYYFAIFAFFISFATCIFFIFHREIGKMFIYGLSMIITIVLVFLIYPAGIAQITGSETNNVGNVVSENILNFTQWKNSFITMLKNAYYAIIPGVFTNFIWICIIIIITVVMSCVLRNKQNREERLVRLKDFVPVMFFLIILLMTVCLISHISAKFVYVRYIYNLFPLFALAISLIIYLMVKMLKLNINISAIGFCVIWMLSSIGLVQQCNCTYLYRWRYVRDNKIIQMYQDRPMIMLNNGSTYQPTGLLHMILEAKHVYLADYDEIEDINMIFSDVDCSNGVVFIILTDRYWSSGYNGDDVMKKIVDSSEKFDNYDEIGNCDFSTAYLAYY